MWILHEHPFEKADTRVVFKSNHHGYVFVLLVYVARAAPFHGFGESAADHDFSEQLQFGGPSVDFASGSGV